MSRENPSWGVPRIQAELHLLGYEIADSTVAKYRVRNRQPPSPTWKRFLRTHAGQIAAIDFFTLPIVTFNVLYCFVVLLHDRRHVVHFNVTAHPTAQWTAQQIIEAFPEESAPRSIRRECLDHLIVLGEGQLRDILREYFAYYNEVRPHQSLEKNAPVPREIEPPAKGKIISLPQVGGLHHRYLRAA